MRLCYIARGGAYHEPTGSPALVKPEFRLNVERFSLLFGSLHPSNSLLYTPTAPPTPSPQPHPPPWQDKALWEAFKVSVIGEPSWSKMKAANSDCCSNDEVCTVCMLLT